VKWHEALQSIYCCDSISTPAVPAVISSSFFYHARQEGTVAAAMTSYQACMLTLPPVGLPARAACAEFLDPETGKKRKRFAPEYATADVEEF
jgi:hypothetical protein